MVQFIYLCFSANFETYRIAVSCNQSELNSFFQVGQPIFQLCAEDYHWWWRSFIVGGGSGFYVLLYSIFYFFTKLEISSFVPCLLYFGYTILITITFSCFTGTVSFYSSYIFINKIYGQIKID